MLEVEDFKQLIKQSIIYKTKNDPNIPYFIIEDTLIICPYCKQQIKMKDGFISCNCIDALEAKKVYNALFNELESVQKRIQSLNNKIEETAIETFISYYKEKVIPRLQEEFDSKNKDILSIKDLN